MGTYIQGPVAHQKLSRSSPLPKLVAAWLHNSGQANQRAHFLPHAPFQSLCGPYSRSRDRAVPCSFGVHQCMTSIIIG